MATLGIGAGRRFFDVSKIGDAASTHPPDTLNLLPDCLNRFAWRTDDGIV
jgi:hypothetical protein